MRLLLLALTLVACAHAPARVEAPPATAKACVPSDSLTPWGRVAVPCGEVRDVVLFLHGMYRAEAWRSARAQENDVVATFLRAGVAVVSPPGEVRLCPWLDDAPAWVCWPSARFQAPDLGRIGDRSWAPLLLEAARTAHAGTPLRLHVFGFSNGGFAAAMLASETSWEVTSYVVAHGGAGPDHTPLTAARARPLLVLTATEDALQAAASLRLADRARAAGWPVERRERPGGHALTQADLEAALEFIRAHGR